MRTPLCGMLILCLALAVEGCNSITKNATKSFVAGETVLLADLSAYVASDKVKNATAATGQAITVAAQEQTAIQAHLAQVQAGLSGVPADEENTFMSELLAYISADQSLVSLKRKALQDQISAHLGLFNSLTAK